MRMVTASMNKTPVFSSDIVIDEGAEFICLVFWREVFKHSNNKMYKCKDIRVVISLQWSERWLKKAQAIAQQQN